MDAAKSWAVIEDGKEVVTVLTSTLWDALRGKSPTALTAWLANMDGRQFCSTSCAAADGVPFQQHGAAVCGLQSCSEPTLRHSQSGDDLGYCSEDHRRQSKLVPHGQRHMQSLEPYVQRLLVMGSNHNKTACTLSALDEAHPEFPSLREQFRTKWLKSKPAGGVSVMQIFKIKVPAEVCEKYDKYSRTVKNIRRRFHGTSCSDGCNFMVDPHGAPCGLRSCSVCNICMQGFQLRDNVGRSARAGQFKLRYGRGVYFSSVSSKANDYATLSGKVTSGGTKLRCMFVANVAVGVPYMTKEGSLDDSMCPPRGYQSVVGEAGKDLNYDEVTVYKEEAALPTYLIVYALP